MQIRESQRASATRIELPKLSRGTVVEVPWVASSSIDAILGRDVKPRTLQHWRSDIRDRLGLVEPSKISLGHYGSFQLENAVVIPCLMTRSAWRGARSLSLMCGSLESHGLLDLTHSESYVAAVDDVCDYVRGYASTIETRSGQRESDWSISRVVNRAVRDALAESGSVRNLAHSYARIVDEVAADLAEVERVPGRVVRFEDDKALVVMETGRDQDRDERLDTVDRAYLAAVGVEDEGDPFMLLKLSFSPQTVVSAYLPALIEGATPPEELERIDRLLSAYEEPLASEQAFVSTETQSGSEGAAG